MIRITVELVPRGNENKKRVIGTAVIANDASGTPKIGNYEAALSTRHKKPRVWKSVAVDHFPRQRLGAWDLLYRVLRAAVGDRNKEAE